MQAVILAGGFGSRLRPLTDTLPKPLVPVAGKSATARILSLLARHGCTDAILTLYYKAEQIEQAFGDSYQGIRLRYVREDTPRATAGSVKLAAPYLKEAPFLVIAADVVCETDLTALLAFHRQKGARATIALSHTDDPLEYGVVLCAPDGQIERFLEKPSRAQAYADTVNTGIYYFEHSILDEIPPDRPFDFSRDLFPTLLGKGLYGYPTDAPWCDIGEIDAYYTHSFRLARAEGSLTEGNNILGKNVSIHPTATVRNCILWDDVTVGPSCRLEGAILCDGVTLEGHVQMEPRSVAGAHCHIGQGAILREGVRLGANSTIDKEITKMQHYSYPNTARSFLFDGGIHGTKEQLNPAFLLQLGQSVAACVSAEGGAKRRVGVFHADTPYCALLCSAFRCGVLGGGVNLEFDGIGFPALAAFTAHRRGTLTLCIFEEANATLRISIYDENGLYPDRKTERALCSAFATSHKVDPLRLGVCEAIEGNIAAYQDALAAELGDLSGVSLYLNHCAPARIFATACRQGGAICNAAPDALRLLFDADGRGVALLESTPEPFSCDFWHVLAILIEHTDFDRTKPLPLPFAAPMHLRQLAAERGYQVHLYSECPHDASEDAIRARAAQTPALRDAVFACARLLALCRRTGQAVSELAKNLPAFSTTARKIAAPTDAPLKLLSSLGAADGDGVRICYSAVRQVRVLPLGAYALRLICEAESMEAAQELFVTAKKEIEQRARALEAQKEEKA